VSAMSAVSRPNGANGDGDGENDRKERFHGTKVFVAARSCASTDCSRDCVADRRFEFQKRRQLFVRRAPVNAATLCRRVSEASEGSAPREATTECQLNERNL
jgi:hypothetical protein